MHVDESQAHRVLNLYTQIFLFGRNLSKMKRQHSLSKEQEVNYSRKEMIALLPTIIAIEVENSVKTTLVKGGYKDHQSNDCYFSHE